LTYTEKQRCLSPENIEFKRNKMTCDLDTQGLGGASQQYSSESANCISLPPAWAPCSPAGLQRPPASAMASVALGFICASHKPALCS
jgi:hypothetical protein